MTIQRPDPADAALGSAEETIGEARDDLAAERSAQMQQADTAAERQAVTDRFDALDARLDSIAEGVRSQVSETVSATVTPLGERIDSLGSKLDDMMAGAMGGQGGDDIVSIEEITEGAGEAIGQAGEAASAPLDAAADVIDDAPRRVHALFRPLWGGKG